MKRQVQGVSFPRSGHHMLERFLREYFRDEFHYCDYYTHCAKRPCTEPGNHYQKHHDFELTLPNDDRAHYLIQIRHPLYATTSNYYLYFWHSLRKGKLSEDLKYGSEPSDLWNEFALRDVRFWCRWVRKWVLDSELPDTFILVYEDVMECPHEALERVVEYFCPSREPDRRRIGELAEKFKIEPKRELGEFHHFDVDFFRHLEQIGKQEIEALGYPLLSWDDGPLPRFVSRATVASA